jgi:hypothetical protein
MDYCHNPLAGLDSRRPALVTAIAELLSSKTSAQVTRRIRDNMALLANLIRQANGKGQGALVGAVSAARAVGDQQLSQEILQTVARLLQQPVS